jgi:hypothetical protein
MSRACPEHGEKTVCISSDARFYWISKGNPKTPNATVNRRNRRFGRIVPETEAPRVYWEQTPAALLPTLPSKPSLPAWL